MKRRNFLKGIAAVAAAPAALLVPSSEASLGVFSAPAIMPYGITYIDSVFVRQYRREFLENFKAHNSLFRQAAKQGVVVISETSFNGRIKDK